MRKALDLDEQAWRERLRNMDRWMFLAYRVNRVPSSPQPTR
jgi:hypothetical protein